MENKINYLLKDTMAELSEKSDASIGDNSYEFILKQLEFVYDCLINNKNMFEELNGRELSFAAFASKNLSGPDEDLLKRIGDISIYLSKL